MLLAANIGNTDIALCVFNGAEIVFSAELSANTARSADEYAILFMQTFVLHKFDPACITDVIISSVVPSLDDTLRAAIAHFTSAHPAFVGAGMKTGLRIRIDTPSQLGADLVALAVASKRYTDSACIVVSFDTATTMTVLDCSGDIAGVVIMPGVLSAAKALGRDTALLTEIALSASPIKRVIGKNTTESLRSGLILGCAAQIDGMATYVKEELGCARSVLLACGKYAPYIVPHCRTAFVHVPHLLFYGLYDLAQKNKP